MRHQIDKTEFAEICSGSLAEGFETFVQQTHYLEVIIGDGRGDNEIAGFVETFGADRGFYNMSHYFEPVAREKSAEHPSGYTYQSTLARDAGEFQITYWRYDTMSDAIAHSVELLSTVTATI